MLKSILDDLIAKPSNCVKVVNNIKMTQLFLNDSSKCCQGFHGQYFTAILYNSLLHDRF